MIDCQRYVSSSAARPFAIRTHSPIHSASQEYKPTVFQYVTNRQFDGKIVQITFWDTASHDHCDRLRPLDYLESHAILIAFAVDSPDSFENIREKVRTPSTLPPLPICRTRA